MPGPLIVPASSRQFHVAAIAYFVPGIIALSGFAAHWWFEGRHLLGLVFAAVAAIHLMVVGYTAVHVRREVVVVDCEYLRMSRLIFGSRRVRRSAIASAVIVDQLGRVTLGGTYLLDDAGFRTATIPYTRYSAHDAQRIVERLGVPFERHENLAADDLDELAPLAKTALGAVITMVFGALSIGLLMIFGYSYLR